VETPAGQSAPKGSRMTAVVLVVVIVVLGAGFGYYYVQSTGTISSLSQTISLRNAKISSLNATIATDDAQIANLTGKVSSLRSTVASDEAKIAQLTTGYEQANATIASLNGQISTLNTTIASDEAQISSLQFQVTELTAILNLAQATVEVGPQSFTTTGNQQVVVFAAQYAGYVVIGMSTASDFSHEGINLDDHFASNVNSPSYSGVDIPAFGLFYTFGAASDSIVIPVAPGTVTVYLDTSDATIQSATLTVTYYY
jgi:cell division protein FtsL